MTTTTTLSGRDQATTVATAERRSIWAGPSRTSNPRGSVVVPTRRYEAARAARTR